VCNSAACNPLCCLSIITFSFEVAPTRLNHPIMHTPVLHWTMKQLMHHCMEGMYQCTVKWLIQVLIRSVLIDRKQHHTKFHDVFSYCRSVKPTTTNPHPSSVKKVMVHPALPATETGGWISAQLYSPAMNFLSCQPWPQ